jgi:hypothetical protein
MNSMRNKILTEAATTITGDPMVAKRIALMVARMEAAEGKGDYSAVKELAGWLLDESNGLNRMHWQVDKMSKHELLQEAYDLCRDTGDQLAETYIALTGNAAADVNTDDEVVIEKLQELRHRINDAAAKNDGYPEGLKNIFADFDEKITSIMYKYRQFDK